jgi:hypothetical protein
MPVVVFLRDLVVGKGMAASYFFTVEQKEEEDEGKRGPQHGDGQ